MESILTSIKKQLGITEEYKHFDDDITMHINSVFMILTQLGVGPSEGFYIENDTAKWTDFISDVSKLQAVKSYVFLKVKLLFDPGSLGSATLAAYERQIQELEWRLNIEAETRSSSGSDNYGETSHYHANKTALDSYNKTQSELLVAAKSEAQSLVSELKTTIDTALKNKADKATTLSGYGVTDAYNKDEIDASLKIITDELNDVEGILNDSY